MQIRIGQGCGFGIEGMLSQESLMQAAACTPRDENETTRPSLSSRTKKDWIPD